MTDKQFGELLVLFHRIEELIDKKGAVGKSFSEKVKSFDTFGEEPENPGDIGYKFYFKNDAYHIKGQYEDDYDIDDELDKYEQYKTWKKRYWDYRNQILNGNYATLKKIAHERNQLMHIFNYEIDNYKKFVKVCRSMIAYLENPSRKQFFGYAKFDSSDKNESSKENIPIANVDTLSFNKRSKLIMLDHLLDYIINIKTVVVFFITIASIIGLKYLISNGIVPDVKMSLGQYSFIGMILYLVIYNYSKVLNFITQGLKKIFEVINDFLTEIFRLVLGLIGVALPYAILLIIVFYAITSKRSSNTSRDIVKEDIVVDLSNITDTMSSSTSTESPKAIDNKTTRKSETCSYYYVKTDNLNVRVNANSTSKIVDKVHRNEKLCIAKKEMPWFFIENKGWVHSKYLSDIKVAASNKEKKKRVAKKDVEVWHCSAKSERASGWVEKVGKQNAINGALHQCEIRRVSDVKCSLDNCYQIR